MTVILLLTMFAIFLTLDWLTGKKPRHDARVFNHNTNDQFAELGITAADGGKKI